jgi:hypothetical protein
MKNYKCTNSKNGWAEGNYQIDKQNHNSSRFAIWSNKMWCVSGLKTRKVALKILNEEFINVELIND